MKQVTSILAAALILCSGAGAWAANSVVVEPTTLGTNGNDCEIRVRLENDVNLNGFQIPLVIREVTPGAFITEMQLVFDDRLGPGGYLGDIQILQHHAEPDGSCKPGGFGAATYTDGLPHPVAASPECALFVALAIMPTNQLPPGTDMTGSLLLTVDLTGTPGTFEIDTTCTEPNIHVLFADDYGMQVIPSFTKGTVTIVSNSPPVALCTHVSAAADASCEGTASVDNGSYDPNGDALTITQTPPGPYPLGDTDVWLVVSDPYCAIDSCSATVTVVDTMAPVITCVGDTSILVLPTETGAIVDFVSSAVDNCSGVSVVCVPPSGSLFPLGTTLVTCTATDAYFNTSQCMFEVTVLKEVCNNRPEDVNCDGVVDVLDVVKTVNVAFRGSAESAPCCNTVP